MASFGEFDFNGVHIDINMNLDHFDSAATTLHELSHQTLCADSYTGALDFLLMNISAATKDEKVAGKVKQLYKRVNDASIRVQESVAMFQELSFLKAYSIEKFNDLLSYYKNEADYYKLYRFGDLEFLLFEQEMNEQTALNLSSKITKVALLAMNINLLELDPLDGKYLVLMEKKLNEYNPNYRFSRIIELIKRERISLNNCGLNELNNLYFRLGMQCIDYDWEKFEHWATEKLTKPLGVLPAREYIEYKKNENPSQRLLSASAYNSSRPAFKYVPCNEKNEIENAFTHSQVLYIEKNDEINAVRNLLVNYKDKVLYEFATRKVFVNWFNYIPIVFTDRNHYKELVEISPEIENTWLFVDLAEFSRYLIEFITEQKVSEYFVYPLNSLFVVLFMKGSKSNIFFHMTTAMNTEIWKTTHLKNCIERKIWWSDIIPKESLSYFSEFVTHQY